MPRTNTTSGAIGYLNPLKAKPVVIDSVGSGTQDAFIVKYNSNVKPEWATRITSTGTGETVTDVITDSSGNFYATGAFSGTNAFFYNADGTVARTLANSGGNDAFLAKYNTNGNLLWIAILAGTSSDVSNGVGFDTSGNLYVVGSYTGTLTINSSDATVFGILSNAGGTDAFIVKYNSSGIAQWSARVATTSTDTALGVAVDGSGNPLLTGYYTGTATIYNSDTTTFGTLSNAGGTDAFIVKYNSTGTAQWSARVGGTTGDQGNAIAIDSSANIVVVGFYTGTVTFYNANATSFGTLTNAGGNDAYIVKYNSSGTVQWTTRISGTGSDITNSVAIDSSDNIYVTGLFTGTATVYNSSGTSLGTLSNAGGTDAFIVKYGSDGTAQWRTRVAGGAGDSGNGIAVDTSGAVYVTGSGSYVTVYNADTTSFSTLFGSGGSIFIVKYNSSGVAQWSRQLTSGVSASSTMVNVDSSGNIYTCGYFTGSRTAVYGQARSVFTTLANSGNTDGFVVKYNRYGNPQWAARMASSGADVAWNSATDSNGNVYVSGTYGANVTIYNADGSTFTTFTYVGGVDGFIVKYDPNGAVLWAVRITGGDNEWATALAVDSAGSVYVSGEFRSTNMTIYNSDGTTFGTLSPSANQNGDVFIVKYNSSGFAQWRSRLTSASAFEASFGLRTDSSNNLYVAGNTGSNQTMIILNSDDSQFGTLSNSGNTDAFLIKYNSSGTAQWATRVASTGADIGYSVTIDLDDNPIFVGSYVGTVTVYNSDTTTFGTLASVGLSEAFIVKYNSSGTVQWAARMVSSNNLQNDVAYSCVTDSVGNVYVGGIGAPTVYNANGTAYTSLGAGSFIAKYSPSGTVLWAFSIAGTSGSAVYSIGIDSNDNLYLGGVFGTAGSVYNILNVDGSTVVTTSGVSAIIKYDKNGFLQWIQNIRGIGTVRGVYVSTTPLGDTYLAGQSGSGSTIQITNTDRTPYIFLNARSKSVYLLKYTTSANPIWGTIIASNDGGVSTGYSTCVDTSNNIYVLAQSISTVSVYNSDLSLYGSITLPAYNNTIIVKYSGAGFIQWTTKITTSTANNTPYDITTDSSNNVYVTGTIANNSITIYNSDGTTFSTIGAAGDAFVVKYNSSGTAQWATRFSGGTGYGLTTDSSENVIVTGSYTGTTTIYNAAGTTFGTLTNAGGTDAILIKYNSSGAVQWATRLSQVNGDIGYAVRADSSGNILVGGSYVIGNLTVYNSDGSTFGTLTGIASTTLAFLVKYNSSGTAQWATRFAPASNGTGVVYDITTDSSGNVYIAGAYAGTGTFYNSDTTTFGTITSVGTGSEAICIKYNSSGTIQWAAKSGSYGAASSADSGRGVAVDSAGNVYISGIAGGTNVSFTAFNADGTEFGSTTRGMTAFASEVFIIKYNSSGQVQWLSNMGGGDADDVNKIRLDSKENFYICGSTRSAGLVPSNT